MGIRRGGARGLLIAAGLVSSIVAVGCGGSAHASAAQQARVLAQAASNVSAASGLKVDISVNETVGGPSVAFTATGSFTPRTGSGSMMMTMRVPGAGGSPTAMRIVIAGGTIYERLPSELAYQMPGRKPWLSLKVSQLDTLNQLPGLNAFIRESLIFGNPQPYVTLLEALAGRSTKEVGPASVNGLQTTQYASTIGISKLPTANPSPDRQAAQQLTSLLHSHFHASAMPVNVWIDRAHLIRRIESTLNGTTGGHVVSVAITEDIVHYGTQATPTAPLPGNTTDLLSLVEGLPPSVS